MKMYYTFVWSFVGGCAHVPVHMSHLNCSICIGPYIGEAQLKFNS